MGGCFSDVRGGKEAVGGGAPHPAFQGSAAASSSGTADVNEAVDMFLHSRGLGGLYAQLELSLSASKLCNLDYLSESDPLAVVYAKRKDGTLEELGRTEVIMNTLNPVWITKLTITYQFEMVQPLLFRLYDVDTRFHNLPVKMLKLNEQEFLGEASCTLSEIVTKHNRSLTLELQDQNRPVRRKDLGSITVHAEETVASRTVVEIIFRCSSLENKDIFSKSDPFLRISRVVESGGAIPVCKTEVIDNRLNPVWKPIYLTMQQFVSIDNPLIIECYDFNSNGKHSLIGKLQKTVAELEKLHKERIGANFYVPSSVSKEQKKILKSQLHVDKFNETSQYTFVDYISSGFELNFMVAVDFTASNGDPRLPNSLHYIDPSGRLNAYQQAILEVGEVIQFYDTDRRFPAWGFGGKPIYGPVSHCFNLNGRADDCEVEGVDGILSAYASALHNVSLAGPTLFGQVINKAAQIASSSLSFNNNKYFVLLIITDGVITDLQETMDSLVKASDLPLSIMIVGVGGADFKEMEILDADNGKRLESSTGRIATRDIVQFVPLREIHSLIGMWGSSKSDAASLYAFYQFSTSGAAVAVATGVTHPLDVVKVRLQMQLVGKKGPLNGMGNLVAQLVKVEGPKALYLGFAPALTRSALYGGLRLGLYEPCKYVCDFMFGSTNILVKIASGAFSGAIATALTNPVEVLKVRLQMSSNSRRGPLKEAHKIIREEGIKALWKGVGPAMARASALTASQLSTYDESKQALLRWTSLEEGFHLHLMSSCIAGTVGTLVTAPMDMIKTRLMLQQESNGPQNYRNGFHCAHQVACTEGFRALYKGGFATFARLGPQTMITFLVCEKLREVAGMKAI